MKETFQKMKCLDKENIHLKMEIYILGNLWIINLMGKVHIQQMVKNIQELGKTMNIKSKI